MDNLWMHILIVIPIEFMVLHATPLGPMLTGFGHDMFSSLGFDFASAAHGAVETAAAAPAAASAAAPAAACHFAGPELVCA